ncbi:unnamed protein product [Adineta steineri]|uniref:Uncharacterized protein n=1 Tax=Adineta steineri TaxID=433720 RepID=A0A814PHG6_9BILA|nr:unnamed protein product [Adineta steineri]CAF3661742.1 unnamed protein product [Adineta steineri]
MALLYFYIFLLSLSLTYSCDIFVGMTCTCYDSNEVRCTMSKFAPLIFSSPSVVLTKKFHSIDLKFESDEKIELEKNYFHKLNQLLPESTRRSVTITFRFHNFQSFHAKTNSFANLFQGITSPNKRLTVELQPLKAETIMFDQNAFDNIHVNEFSMFADSLSSPFESIFNNTNITNLNIEGAIVTHDPSLVKQFTGRIQSLKITRMIDTVNDEEFPPFPVQSYTIEAHKMRTLDALSFRNYPQLTGLNIIQPDVSITPKILQGLDNILTLKSLSLDAERIADGALKYVKHIHTLILGSYLKILDVESLNSLKSLQQLDVRYVQFSTLQGNTSCALADFINRRRMLGLTVYLPTENSDCDCILVFLNNMVDDGSQLVKCQSTNNDRCLFSSCSIVSEYFTRKQKEDLEEQQQKQQQQNTPPLSTPSAPVDIPFVPPSVDMDGNDLPYYPNENIDEHAIQTTTSSTINLNEGNVYDDNDLPTKNINIIPTTTIPSLSDLEEELDNEYSTPLAKRVHPDSKKHSNKPLVVSWIPFAIIGSCLFLTLVIAMISYIIYHKKRITSFKLVPQAAPII